MASSTRPQLGSRHSGIPSLRTEIQQLSLDIEDSCLEAWPVIRRRRAYTTPVTLSPVTQSSLSPEFPLYTTPVLNTPTPLSNRQEAGEEERKKKEKNNDKDKTPRTLLDKLLSEGGVDLDAYGITEYRDGFFDALFFRPTEMDRGELLMRGQDTLPAVFKERSPLSVKDFVPQLWNGSRGVLIKVSSTREGIKLAKAFAAFFIAYILCLIPLTHRWLGQYSFYMVISTIICHPSRTVGAQIEGAVFTSIGTIAGLGWGALGLLVSTSTPAAREGYGGVLAVFVALFMGIISIIRASYIRLYQLVLCAGIAATYACLSDVKGKSVEWVKFYDHAVPWILGQVVALIVNIAFFPDAGARPIATTMHDTFGLIMDGLDVSQLSKDKLKRKLADSFVDLDQAYYDLSIEITISRFYDHDIKELVDLLQGVVRSLISFEDNEEFVTAILAEETGTSTSSLGCDSTTHGAQSEGRQTTTAVVDEMSIPTKLLLSSMKQCVMRCDAIIMDLSGYRKYLGPPQQVPTNLDESISELREAMRNFDAAEGKLLEKIGPLPEIAEIFVFCRPIREAGAAVEGLSVKINEMKVLGRHLPQVNWPSLKFWESLNRTNAQIRHDRGGVTAGSYYKSFGVIAGLIKNIKEKPRMPRPLENDPHLGVGGAGADLETPILSDKTRFRYRLWKFIHRIQGFESKYALKMIILTGLLSIPAWIKDTGHRDWWNTYNCWWMVAMAWIMVHPRVGGNLQDLLTRCFFAILGAMWGVLAYTAGSGNPVVMAVFAVIYMLPMIYRFTQSSHPRSGLVGCLSFTIVSLTAYNSVGDRPAYLVGVNTGLATAGGIAAAILINWILWPFVSRHELRKAVATMLFYMSVTYRTVVAKYVYYEGSHSPEPEDMERAEQVERMLREGFVRIRQLLELTRHEFRLRAKFDPRPYAALIDSCERFFQYLVGVRQASLSYNRSGGIEDVEAAGELLSYRRDTVAAVLSNLYILSGALRSNRSVPRYLPSALAARKRLLEKLDHVCTDPDNLRASSARPPSDQVVRRHRKAQAYDYLYHQCLTGCVAQLQELEKFTKEIVGEKGFDDVFEDHIS